MKSTTVDEEGNVVCPKCGAKNQFAIKRTGKAKLIGVATVGVGALAMPEAREVHGMRDQPEDVRGPLTYQRPERTLLEHESALAARTRDEG